MKSCRSVVGEDARMSFTEGQPAISASVIQEYSANELVVARISSTTASLTESCRHFQK
jgi:hypothetical protein